MLNRYFFSTAACLLLATPAFANEPSDNIGFIENVDVVGQRLESFSQPGATSIVSADDIELRGIERVSEALVTVPGVTFQPGNRGGSRNEASVYVRGYDLSRVPVLLDGVPIYVPFDGYLDLNRLQTFDLEAIEVARGYASVLYGPNAMAGAINLVSRRPVEGFSGSATLRADFDRHVDHQGTKANVVAAYGESQWYVRATAGWLDQDYWQVPGSFESGVYQPEGDRVQSSAEDKAFNLRAAWTPGEDEYALTYINEKGAKQAPPYAGDVANDAAFFNWPYYDKESLYLNTNSYLDSGLEVSGRLYYDSFKNQLRRYDDDSYSTQYLPYAFTSSYDDYMVGGSFQVALPMSAHNELRAAAFFKQDTHRESNPGGPTSRMVDNTGSLAVSLRSALADALTLSGGVSYDFRTAEKADNPYDPGTSFELQDKDAFNWQAGLDYTLGSERTLYLGVSQKSRFATMYERYSFRLGFAEPNADLNPEQLLTVEGGVRGQFASWLSGSAGLFWSETDNYIQSVTIGQSTSPPFSSVSQFQNIGNVETVGVELELNAAVDWFTARLAYTWLDRKLTNRQGVSLYGTPDNKIDLQLHAQLGHGFYGLLTTVYRDGMDTSDAVDGEPINSYTDIGLRGGWASSHNYAIELGVLNLFDEYYEYDDGYPAAGRSYNITLSYTF